MSIILDSVSLATVPFCADPKERHGAITGLLVSEAGFVATDGKALITVTHGPEMDHGSGTFHHRILADPKALARHVKATKHHITLDTYPRLHNGGELGANGCAELQVKHCEESDRFPPWERVMPAPDRPGTVVKLGIGQLERAIKAARAVAGKDKKGGPVACVEIALAEPQEHPGHGIDPRITYQPVTMTTSAMDGRKATIVLMPCD